MSEEADAWLQAHVKSCDALPACAFQLVLETNKTVVRMTETTDAWLQRHSKTHARPTA